MLTVGVSEVAANDQARVGWLPWTAGVVALLSGVCTAAYGWAVLHVVVPNLFGERSGFGWLGAATGIGGGVTCVAGAVVVWRCARGSGDVRRPLQLAAAAAAIAALPSIGDLVQFVRLSIGDGEPWATGEWAAWWPAAPALLPLLTSIALVCAWPLCARREHSELPTSIGLGSRVWVRGLVVLLVVGWSWWVLTPFGWYARTDLQRRFRRSAIDLTDAVPPVDLAGARWRIEYEQSQPGVWYRDWFEAIDYWVLIAEELDAGSGVAQRPGPPRLYRLAYPGTLDVASALAEAGALPGDPELDRYLLALAGDPHLMVEARDLIVWALADRPDLAPGSLPVLLAIASRPAMADDALLDYGTPLQAVLPTVRMAQVRRLRKTAFNALATLGAAAAPVLQQLQALQSDPDLGGDADYAVEMIEAELAMPEPELPPPADAGEGR